MSSLRPSILAFAASIAGSLACLSTAAYAEAPSLDTERAVLERAVEVNPTLRAALAQLADAGYIVAGEESRFPWTLTIDAGGTRTSSPRIIAGASTVGEIYGLDSTTQLQKHLRWGTDLNFSVRGAWQKSITPQSLSFIGIAPNGNVPTVAFTAKAGVTQPFLRGSGETVTLATLNVARGQRSQAVKAAERTASALLRDVRTAYWEVWYAAESLRIQERSRDLAVAQRDDAERRVTTGSLSPADALPFRTRAAQREEDVIGARAELERQKVALAGRIGMLARGDRVGAPTEEAPAAPKAALPNVEADVLEASPELGDLKAAIDVARTQRASAGDANRARLDANAYVQLDGLGSADAGAAAKQLATFGAVSAHAGLTFDTPLDSGRRTADIARANTAIELAEARYEERREQVLSDLRTALTREDGARMRIEVGEKTLEFAGAQLTAERKRFETGSSTALAVLQAEDDVRNATLRVARAKVDRLEQAIVREHLAGRLLAEHGDLVSRRLPEGRPTRGTFERAAY